MRLLIVLICLMCQSCTRLSRGPIPPPEQMNIFLIRGYLDWYSIGIDQLTRELKNDGQNAQAYREEQWGDLADAIAKHPTQPIALIGFSYGADDVILIARKLSARNIPVDLLITLDPVTPAHIPKCVRQCINFYEPNGVWDLFPWLRGVPLIPDPGATVQNINIRTDLNLNQPNTSHRTIAQNEKIHDAIRKILGS